MRLSIIVPVYNGERHVAECLKSLVGQWVEGVEVIVVNDGSTDRTGDLVDAEVARGAVERAWRHIKTSNGGVSAARNHGLDAAHGEYVAFVDADDVVDPHYLTTLLAALAGEPDIVEFGYRSVSAEGNVLSPDNYIHTRFGWHSVAQVSNAVYAACLWYPFLRVVRRSLFSDVRFPVGVRFCEDMMTLSAIYPRAATVRSLPNVLYSYRMNLAGATRNVGADYATKLIAFYRSLPVHQDFANHALKISVCYAARSCLSRSTDPLARLPSDIEREVRWLPLRSPALLFAVPTRFIAFAVAGPLLFFLRRLAVRLGIKRLPKASPPVERSRV